MGIRRETNRVGHTTKNIWRDIYGRRYMEMDTHGGGHIEIDTWRWTHRGKHIEVDTKRKTYRGGHTYIKRGSRQIKGIR